MTPLCLAPRAPNGTAATLASHLAPILCALVLPERAYARVPADVTSKVRHRSRPSSVQGKMAPVMTMRGHNTANYMPSDPANVSSCFPICDAYGQSYPRALRARGQRASRERTCGQRSANEGAFRKILRILHKRHKRRSMRRTALVPNASINTRSLVIAIAADIPYGPEAFGSSSSSST